jgi:hypothetical protein
MTSQTASPRLTPKFVEAMSYAIPYLGQARRRAHQRPGRRRPRFAQAMLSIHQRRFAPADLSQPGH